MTAFIGYFKRGATNKAVQIFSLEEFKREFGGLDSLSEASYAIQQFYLNGGGEAWVVRCASNQPNSAEIAIRSATSGSAVLKLTRETIRNKLRSSQPPILRTLSTAELDQQIEQIKISPETLSTEEMSKLWSTFQSHYRPTAAYQVSVVLIESRRPTKSALPVREPKLHVMPFKRPLIEAVLPQILFSGDTLTIQGQNLKAAIVKVNFGVDPPTPLNLNDITDTKIQVSPPANLRAGVNTVQVLHLLNFGTGSPSEPHRGFESNVVAFILAPRITTSFPITVSRGGTLTLSVISPVEANQRVAILLNDRAIARSTTGPGTPTEPKFLIPDDFPTGEFLLRLQVDGAESRLDVDQNNQYIGPKIAIT